MNSKRTVLALISIALVAVVFPNIASWPLQKEVEYEDAATLVVLGHRLENNSTLSLVGTNRLDAALEFYNHHRPAQVLVAGGNSNGNGLEADAMEKYLVQKGIPAEKILKECRSTNTYENVEFVNEICQQQGLTKIHVITSAFHSRRAARLLRDSGRSFSISVPTQDVLNNPSSFGNRISAFKNISREYLATIWFDVFYFKQSLVLLLAVIALMLWSILKHYDWLAIDMMWCIKNSKPYVARLKGSSKLSVSQILLANKDFGRNHAGITEWLSRIKIAGPVLAFLYRFPVVQLLLVVATWVVIARQQTTLQPVLLVALFTTVLSQLAVRCVNRFFLGRYADHLDDSIVLNPNIDRESSTWLLNNGGNQRMLICTTIDLVCVTVVFTAIFALYDVLSQNEQPTTFLLNLTRFLRVGINGSQHNLEVVIALVELAILIGFALSMIATLSTPHTFGIPEKHIEPKERGLKMDKKKVFISYSHDTEAHKDWVANLAERLKLDGYEVKLDQLDLTIGDNLPEYMESSIRESDLVFLICTPAFAKKANDRTGGVGWETLIATGVSFVDNQLSKFVCLLREGTDSESLPTWAKGTFWVNFRGDEFDRQYVELLEALEKKFSKE